MRTDRERKILLKIASLIAALVFILPALTLNAEGTILLSLSTLTETISPGDIININVSCDKFESITSFGPVVIAYDEEEFEFVSVTPSEALAGYSIYTDYSTNGLCEVTGEFDTVIDEETGDEVRPYSTQEQTIIFQVSLRARPQSSGTTGVRIVSTGEFKSTSGSVTSYNGESLTINIMEGVSTDASLSSLSIEGITMNPAFDSSVYEYSATVSRDVTSVTVNYETGNLNATVTVDGADELESGENIISVHVLAQDGISWKEYKIYVNRQESYIPEGSGFVDSNGVTYTFLNLPTNVDLPEGFTQTTRTINGYTVPVFAKDGVVSVLVYVYNGTDNPAFYFYNPVTGVANVYINGSTQITTGRVLTATAVQDSSIIPTGFKETRMTINDYEVAGYVNKNGDFIKYFTDDTGVSDFYYFDKSTETFYLYKSVDKTGEQVYRILFYIFLLTTVIEAIFIVVITYVIRRVVLNRTNPRPKRV